jgi:hypothetical protein
VDVWLRDDINVFAISGAGGADVNNKDLNLFTQARFLQVTELSRARHAVRRAKEWLKEASGFRRQADQALNEKA